MAAAAERRGLVAGICVLAVGVLWAAMAVPAGPAAPAAVATVQWEPPGVRQQVAPFVSTCRDAGAADADRLRELAASRDPLVAGNAIAALGRLQLVHDDARLLGLLTDARPRVRHEVVVALGRSGEPDAARHLTPLLTKNDTQARLLAIQSLMDLGVTAPLDELLANPATDAATRRFVEAVRRPPAVPRLLATTAGVVGG